ncbi:MAG TPA: hypothetical protein VHL09_17420 [Dehalococcoidia bacterium]|nr:hypothetical protein [Dehalococcoidia bacterium]
MYFTVPGEADLHFARRPGRDWWVVNRFRGYRLLGLGCKRVRSQLVAGTTRIPVRLVRPADVLDGAA